MVNCNCNTNKQLKKENMSNTRDNDALNKPKQIKSLGATNNDSNDSWLRIFTSWMGAVIIFGGIAVLAGLIYLYQGCYRWFPSKCIKDNITIITNV